MMVYSIEAVSTFHRGHAAYSVVTSVEAQSHTHIGSQYCCSREGASSIGNHGPRTVPSDDARILVLLGVAPLNRERGRYGH